MAADDTASLTLSLADLAALLTLSLADLATDDNAEYGAENIEAEGETTNDVEGDDVDDVDDDDDVGVGVGVDVGVGVGVVEFVDGLLSPKNESIGFYIYSIIKLRICLHITSNPFYILPFII